MTPSLSTSLSTSLSSCVKRIIRKVVVIGGTHGNEYTGVWVSKALARQLDRESSSSSKTVGEGQGQGQGEQAQQPPQQQQPPQHPPQQPLYQTFGLSTLIGNPSAYLANRRFLDVDLNRQFSKEALDHHKLHPTTVEGQRALELNEILGPKFGDGPPKTDLIIDLHTTTGNMGTTLIVASGDPLTCKTAAYVMMMKTKQQQEQQQQQQQQQQPPPPPLPLCDVSVLMHTHTSQEARPHVSSIASHCFSIEAGPVPQGVIRHDIVEKTQHALTWALEFVERYNTEPDVVDAELQAYFPSGRLPCFVSAPAQRKGEMSSKIAWPSLEDNPNFPTWMVHQSLQDRDFALLKTGDPLFVDLDGRVLDYDGSHGSPIRLLFVNEGGYYYPSSGTGISVAKRRYFDFVKGTLVPEEEGEDHDNDQGDDQGDDDGDEEPNDTP